MFTHKHICVVNTQRKKDRKRTASYQQNLIKPLKLKIYEIKHG